MGHIWKVFNLLHFPSVTSNSFSSHSNQTCGALYSKLFGCDLRCINTLMTKHNYLKYHWDLIHVCPHHTIKGCSASQIKMSHLRLFLPFSRTPQLRLTLKTIPSRRVNRTHGQIETMTFFFLSFLKFIFLGLGALIPQCQHWHSGR